MARALVNNPSLILGDEPTGQLDQKNTDIVVQQLRSLALQGYTIVLVTHEEEIGLACDRIIRIRDGSVVSDGMEQRSSKRPAPKRLMSVTQQHNS